MKRLLFVFLIILTTGLQAQTKEELQRQKVLLQDQIDLASELLLKTKNTKEASLSELQTLNQLTIPYSKYCTEKSSTQ